VHEAFQRCHRERQSSGEAESAALRRGLGEQQKVRQAEAYNGLGMLATIDKKPDAALKDFQLAVENDPDQDAYSTRLANAYLSAGKKAEALAICDKLLAKPTLDPRIKSVVTSLKNAASH
jgi:tetratricopeptide (TPR) repeat protein